MSNKQPHPTPDDTTDEEPLSDQDLNQVEGGVDGSNSRSPHFRRRQDSTDPNSNVLEPGPTFPVPPYPEDEL